MIKYLNLGVDEKPVPLVVNSFYKKKMPLLIQTGVFRTNEGAVAEQVRLTNAGLNVCLSNIEHEGKVYSRLRTAPIHNIERLVMQKMMFSNLGGQTLLVSFRNEN